ncbi:MAG: cation:proton antiporter [Candidatus Aenigmarchaeota archaeon]|nr:cation:proton antiporter [Candidatus Aenigmarchaeota archaeon]
MDNVLIIYTIYILLLSIFVSFIRLVKGPTLPDRVVAADTINIIVIALIVLFSVIYENKMFIDIAIVYALLSFIGNLSISKYLMGMRLHE